MVPDAFFKSYLNGNYKVHPQQVDTGCVQRNFVHINTEETLRQLEQFYKNQTDRISSESRWLEKNKIDLILSDVPSFPMKAGKPLGIPRLLMSNFTWYDIYSAFPEANKWMRVLDILRDEYSTATLQFLPQCHIDNNVVSKKEVVGFISLPGKNIRPELEQSFPSLIVGKTLVYIYFGQFDSSAIQWKSLENIDDCAFITVDPKPACTLPKNLIFLDSTYHHPDLIASSDIVCTKAGYSTLATAFAQGKPVLSCDREGFCEVEAMKDFMSRNQVGLIMDSKKFYTGDWAESIKSARHLTVNGKVKLDGETAVFQKVNSLLQ